ncbi:hypothetical protein J3458_004855 [Metarhizium acridum]|uniref:uncharacterized protein n=1 Tax=Metarhizium acridum TaxID=92637 RepID=UPI001C6CA4EF|nr:hypothetical protein J3458_004855 [Metarhizium acridum]
MAFPLATSSSPVFEDLPSPKYMPSPPSSPATSRNEGDEQGKQGGEDGRLLPHQNPSYQENLRIRQRNLLSTLDHLDAKLEPLLDVDTGKAIPGFPQTLRDIDKLGYDEGYDVLYRVRRWAATRPTENEMPCEGEDAREDKKTTA